MHTLSMMRFLRLTNSIPFRRWFPNAPRARWLRGWDGAFGINLSCRCLVVLRPRFRALLAPPTFGWRRCRFSSWFSLGHAPLFRRVGGVLRFNFLARSDL